MLTVLSDSYNFKTCYKHNITKFAGCKAHPREGTPGHLSYTNLAVLDFLNEKAFRPITCTEKKLIV